jgi:hypothetical protein
MVMVALWLPLLVLFATFVIDVGSWFMHREHLQMQADASALAAGQAFATPCDNNAVFTAAENYGYQTSPAPPNPGGPWSQNQEVAAKTGRLPVYAMYNSSTWYNQSSPADTTVRQGLPCSVAEMDVKLTEPNLPWYFGGSLVPDINAHARVEVRVLGDQRGALPVAVPENNPQSAAVTLVNEDTGAVIATQPLKATGTSGGLQIWDNAASPFTNFTMPASHVGVRIAVSGGTSTTCGDPLVQCYDLGSSNGLVHIWGYSTTPSGAQPSPPQVRDTTLFNGSCSDPYFVSTSTSCTVGVRTKVDAGVLLPASMKITAQAPGCPNNGCPLTFNATGVNAGYWTTNGALPTIAAAAGPVPITLNWEETAGTEAGNLCKNGNGNKCTGSFGVIQRVFSASTVRSGPVLAAQVWEGGATGADSLQIGTSHTLVVKIGTQGSLQYASSVSDPIVQLRVAGGSQNQSVDCDPNYSNLWQELAFGCRPQYTKNTGQACPNSVPSLWGGPQPWPCVAIQTGSATNQVPEGLNTRMLGTSKPNTCPALGQSGHNNWSLYPSFPPGDPRIIQVFLVPFGSFTGNGSGTVPVTGFASFYVTGWTGQGQGFNNPCQGNGDDPVPGNDAGIIVGHFIRYVQTLDNGTPGTGQCNLAATGGTIGTGNCVVVMTQ